MAFYIEKQPGEQIWIPKVASTAFAPGMLIVAASGYATPASTDAGAANKPVIGVYEGPAITSSSSNYASTDAISITQVTGSTILRVTGNSSFKATDVGSGFDVASGALTLAHGTTTYKPATVVKYIAADTVLVTIGKHLRANVA